MSTVTFRLELSSAQVKRLVDLLVADLVDHGPQNGKRYRTGIDVVLYDDDTRKGQRNGHGASVRVDGGDNSLSATAYDLVIDGE